MPRVSVSRSRPGRGGAGVSFPMRNAPGRRSSRCKARSSWLRCTLLRFSSQSGAASTPGERALGGAGLTERNRDDQLSPGQHRRRVELARRGFLDPATWSNRRARWDASRVTRRQSRPGTRTAVSGSRRRPTRTRSARSSSSCVRYRRSFSEFDAGESDCAHPDETHLWDPGPTQPAPQARPDHIGQADHLHGPNPSR